MDWDPVDENEFWFKWYSIADELGIPERTLKRWCARSGIRLRRWGKGIGRPVIIAKEHVCWLRWKLRKLGYNIGRF